MKKFNRLIVLFIGITLFISSCKKKDKENTCALNELSLTGSYKVESVKYKATPTSPETDGTSLFFDGCELDDVTTFNADHTYTYTDAGTTCTPNSDDTGTWTLSGSTLTIDGLPAIVENFSCSNFSLSQSDVNTAGDKITVTWKKQ